MSTDDNRTSDDVLIEDGPDVVDERPADAEAATAVITVFKKYGGKLTKIISPEGDGYRSDGSECHMWSGEARRAPINDITDLNSVIKSLKDNETIGLGNIRSDWPDVVEVVIDAKINRKTRRGIISRSKKFLGYGPRPAPLLIDFDLKYIRPEIAERVRTNGLWETLCEVLPALRGVARIERKSTSSGLSLNGRALEGSAGRHIYIMIKDGRDAIRFLETLFKLCWLHGLGWIMLAENGNELARTIVDRTVGDPSRMVFEAPPILRGGITQEGRDPVVIDGPIAMLDTETACPPLTKDQKDKYLELYEAAKQNIKEEAARVREAWIEKRSKEMIEHKPDLTIVEARKELEVQCQTKILSSHIILHFDEAELGACSVGDVLNDPKKFVNRSLADPFDVGRGKAKIFLHYRTGLPFVHSLAHGTSTNYILQPAPPPPPPPPKILKLDEVHGVFIKWLGEKYDIESLDATLAVTACERLPGDPPWLLIISGSGNAKTETVVSVAGVGAIVVSVISSEGALLSATSRKQRAKNATGGLLFEIGPRGIMVIKDVGSILSMGREVRGPILAALREIYDGRWTRNVGTDGGMKLTWEGRIVVIGASTTAWDSAHSVIASLGDRFVTIRPDSSEGRLSGGRQAMRNTGDEVTMRKELADAVAGLINGIDFEADYYELTEDDQEIILKAADLVTRARTGVETDPRGDVISSHDLEMPTRLAKQLTQIMRGGMAIGMDHDSAMHLVLRCARDSMPQIRLTVLRDVALHPSSSVTDVSRRVQEPRTTVGRTLQALHSLGLVVFSERAVKRNEGTANEKTVSVWHYSLASDVNLKDIDPSFVGPANQETFGFHDEKVDEGEDIPF